LYTLKGITFPIATTVYWKVRQNTANVWGSWSAQMSFTTGTPTITAPASAQNPGTISVVWNAYGQTPTKVYLSEDGTTYDAGVTATTTPTSVTLPVGAARTGAKLQLGYGSPEVKVTSGVFTINASTAIVTSPGSVAPGATPSIAWNSYGATVNKIKFSTDGTDGQSATWSDLTTLTGTSGSTQVTIPAGNGYSTCSIGIFNDNTMVAQTAAFTVSQSTPFVTSPGNVAPGATPSIVWNSYGVTVTAMKFTTDGSVGSPTWSNSTDITGLTSPQSFSIPAGNGYSTCAIGIFDGSGTLVAQTAAFTVSQSAATISTSASSYSAGTAAGSVIFNAYGRTVSGIKLSTDGGTTWGAAQGPGTTPFSFIFPTGSLRNNCKVGLFDDAVSTTVPIVASSVFTITAANVTVTTTFTATEAPGYHTVAWTNGGVSIDKIQMSTDNGSTWGGYSVTLTGSTKTDASASITYDLLSSPAGYAACIIGLFEAAAATPIAQSTAFALTAGGASFTVPTLYSNDAVPSLYSDPGSVLVVPIKIKNTLLKSGNASGKIRAFDLTVEYDSHFMTAGAVTLSATLGGASIGDNVKYTIQNAKTIVTDAGGSPTSSIMISAFNLDQQYAVRECVLNISFTVVNDDTHAGVTPTVTMSTTPIVADENATAIATVVKTASADVKILTSITGKVEYFYEYDATPANEVKWDLDGTNWMHYVSPSDGDGIVAHQNSQTVSVGADAGRAAGVYKIVQIERVNGVSYGPTYDAWPTSNGGGPTAAGVTSADALIAFDVTFAPASYTARQKIAADVNDDGSVNSIDALSIMDISVDTWYTNNSSFKKWKFFTNASVVAQTGSTYDNTVKGTLVTGYSENLPSGVVTGKDFLGVVRGDANFSFGGAADKDLDKSSATPVICNLPKDIQARAGDTVYIPVDVQLNGQSLLALTANLQVENSIFSSFEGVVEGPTFPSKQGWYTVSKYSPENGVLRVSTANFGAKRDPITQEGTVLLLKFVVSKDAKIGTVSNISMPFLEISDKNLKTLNASTTLGKIEITRMGNTMATDYVLSQNYPNPFNPSTTIEYALPKESSVKVEIFNMLGQNVATLFTGNQSKGYHQASWNASNLGSGVYLYAITATSLTDGQTFRSVKKMVLMK
jgi:hypothetical protein